MHIDPLPVSECGRLVGDAPKEIVMDSLKKDKDTRMSQYLRLHRIHGVARLDLVLS